MYERMVRPSQLFAIFHRDANYLLHLLDRCTRDAHTARMRRGSPASELGKLDLFSHCSPDELERIDRLVTTVRVPRGTTLVRQGEPGNQFLVLADGQATVTRRANTEAEEVAALGPGACIGEMALLMRTSRCATVTATADSTILVSTPAEFRQMVLTVPSVAEELRATAARRAVSNLTEIPAA